MKKCLHFAAFAVCVAGTVVSVVATVVVVDDEVVDVAVADSLAGSCWMTGRK